MPESLKLFRGGREYEPKYQPIILIAKPVNLALKDRKIDDVKVIKFRLVKLI
jgi:hypothetical protein